MDPITLMIVTALAAGAAAGLKPVAEQAVKDAYAGLKGLIQRKYPSVHLEPLESKPGSETKRASTGEDLVDAGANKDDELQVSAKALLDLVKQHDPEAAKSIGVDLDNVVAEYLKIGTVHASGTGVKVHDGKFTGGIDIGEVNAGIKGEPPKK